MDEDKSNGHQHERPIERIIVEFEPNAGQLKYRFENSDYHRAIGHLEMAKQFMFQDMLVSQKEAQHADQLHSHSG